MFNDTAITKMISVALLLLPGLGLALPECKHAVAKFSMIITFTAIYIRRRTEAIPAGVKDASQD